MASFAQFLIVNTMLLTCPIITTGKPTVSLLAQRAVRSRATSSFLLRAQPNYDPVAKTFQTLDANHNGYVDPTEVTMFATSQGLDAASASKEFATLDANGDGTLDSTELSNALGVEAPAPAAAVDAVQKPVAMQAHPFAMQAQPIATQVPVAFSAPATQSLSIATPMVAQVSSEALSVTDSQNTVAAQSAATKIVEQLSRESTDEEQAQVFDRQAAELRANSTTLAKMAEQHAMQAASEAASKTAGEVLQSILKLEQQASQAEVEAAGLHAKAKAELMQANEFMAIAGVALQQESHTTM